MFKTKTKKTIMLIMFTVLAMATLFASDVTTASANKVHHKRTHKVYKKKKAKKRHVTKKPKHKKVVAKKKAKKARYKKPAAKKKARRVVRKVAAKKVTHKKRARKLGFKSLYKSASSKLGHPYVYGAVGPYSFDCSGFTQYAYRHGEHKHLARTAQMQYNTNKHISRKHIKKGDLVFFGYSRNAIYHVGIYIGHDRMIDAQNRGVITEKIHEPWWPVAGYARVA